MRSRFIDVAGRAARHYEAQGDAETARAVYQRALDIYPDSARITKALIQARIAEGDIAGALADYARYERMVRAQAAEAPSATIRELIAPFLTRQSVSR